MNLASVCAAFMEASFLTRIENYGVQKSETAFPMGKVWSSSTTLVPVGVNNRYALYSNHLYSGI